MLVITDYYFLVSIRLTVFSKKGFVIIHNMKTQHDNKDKHTHEQNGDFADEIFIMSTARLLFIAERG